MLRLSPSSIFYSQDSISGRFCRGGPISITFEQLLYNEIGVDDIEPITVIWRWNKWWTLTGNRRLYIYKKLEELGIATDIPVIVGNLNNLHVCHTFNVRFTTTNGGADIRIRRAREEGEIERLATQWRTEYRTMHQRLR